MTDVIGTVIGGFAKSVVLGQARTFLPAVGGGLATIGVTNNQVNAASLEGALYYILSAAFVIVPAYFSYMNKKGTQSLVNAAVAVTPGTPEAVAIQAKVS